MWQTLVIVALMVSAMFVVSHFIERWRRGRLDGASRDPEIEGDDGPPRILELIQRLGSADPAAIHEALDAILAHGPGALPRLYATLRRIAQTRAAGVDIGWTFNIEEAVASFGPRAVEDLLSAWLTDDDGDPTIQFHELRAIAARVGEAAIRPIADASERFARANRLSHAAALLRATGAPCHASLQRVMRDNRALAPAIAQIMVEVGELAIRGLENRAAKEKWGASRGQPGWVGRGVAAGAAQGEDHVIAGADFAARVYRRLRQTGGAADRPELDAATIARALVAELARGQDPSQKRDLAMRLAETGAPAAVVPLLHLIEADETLVHDLELRAEVAARFGGEVLVALSTAYLQASSSAQEWAFGVLGDVGTEMAARRAFEALEGMDPSDPMTAIAEFSIERSAAGFDLLTAALTHPKPHVVQSAVRVLRYRRDAAAIAKLFEVADTLIDPFPIVDLARDVGAEIASVVRTYWDGHPLPELEWRLEDLLRSWGQPPDDGASQQTTAAT